MPYFSSQETSHNLFAVILNSLSHFRPDTREEPLAVYLTETIDPQDPHANSPEMKEAKSKEIENLLKRGDFKAVLRKDVALDDNWLPGHFMLTLKGTEDKKFKAKARFVIGEHREKMKSLMIYSAQTL